MRRKRTERIRLVALRYMRGAEDGESPSLRFCRCLFLVVDGRECIAPTEAGSEAVEYTSLASDCGCDRCI